MPEVEKKTATENLMTNSLQLRSKSGGNDLAARRKWEKFVFDTRKRLADKAPQLAEEAERNDRRQSA